MEAPLCQSLNTLWVQNVLPISNLNFLSFSIKPFLLVLSLWDHVKCWSLPCLQNPCKHWKVAMRCPWTLLKLNKASFLSLSSQERCSIPLIIFMALLCTHSNSSTYFLCWGPQVLGYLFMLVAILWEEIPRLRCIRPDNNSPPQLFQAGSNEAASRKS